jgi:hypothetical protein
MTSTLVPGTDFSNLVLGFGTRQHIKELIIWPDVMGWSEFGGRGIVTHVLNFFPQDGNEVWNCRYDKSSNWEMMNDSLN